MCVRTICSSTVRLLALLSALYVVTVSTSASRDSCDDALNPIIILPGIMGSDLDVRLMGTLRGPCSIRSSLISLWPPLNPDIIRNPSCFRYLLQPVPCHSGTNSHLSLCNNPGVMMWVNSGGSDGTDTFAFKQGGYDRLTDYFRREFGYRLGRNMFAVPYDWRLSLQALDESGQFDAIVQRITDAVNKNCNKKAIIVAHSMGTLVALGVLQHPRYQQWRQQYVKGYIALAPPFGGSTYAIASKLGGNKINLLQMLGDFFQPLLNEVIYHGSKGLPSMLMLMPYKGIWGKDYVLVSTPQKNYTLGDMTSLFDAIGDTQSAELWEQSHSLDSLVSKGPITGVETYCIYGSATPTVKQWSYRNIVRDKPAPPGSANAAVMGLGDGVVNLESMRLCSRLTNSTHISELGTGVGHGNVLYHPSSLVAIRQALIKLSKGD